MVNPNRLFSWSDVERRPELERLERVRALPDEELLTASVGAGAGTTIRSGRCGRWWRGSDAQSLLRELGRNPRFWRCAGLIRWDRGVGRSGRWWWVPRVRRWS